MSFSRLSNQCPLSALAKLPQNNTAQINISPSVGQAALISFICQFLPVRASITTSLSSWSPSTWTGTSPSIPDPPDHDVESRRATRQRASVPVNQLSCFNHQSSLKAFVQTSISFQYHSSFMFVLSSSLYLIMEGKKQYSLNQKEKSRTKLSF